MTPIQPVYRKLSPDASIKELIRAIIDGPLREMRNHDLRRRYPALSPALAQLKHELEEVSEHDWIKLGELNVDEESYRSMIVWGVREVLDMCEEKGYWYKDSTQRPARFHRVTPDNTARQISQALYDGPMVDVLLHDSELYLELEDLRQRLDKISVRAWDQLKTMQAKENENGTFAQIIAGNVGTIIENYAQEHGGPLAYIKLVIQLTDAVVTRAREVTHLSLSHRQRRIYRIDPSSWRTSRGRISMGG